MPSDVKVPGLGRMGKGTVLAIAGAGVAVGGYVLLHRKKTTPGVTATDQYGYGAYGYGAYGYGANSGFYGYGSTYSPYGYGTSPYGPYGYGGYGSGFSNPPGGVATAPPPITTNAQWTQAALGILTDQGYGGTAVLAALGLYLTGGHLSADQAGIVSAAIASEGYPPVAGPSGNPPGMNTSVPGGQGGGGGTTYAHNPPTGLKLVHNGRTGIEVQWNAVQGATKYNVHTPGRTPVDFTTTNTRADIGNLKPNTSYTIQVWADPTPTGGPHATLKVKTTK